MLFKPFLLTAAAALLAHHAAAAPAHHETLDAVDMRVHQTKHHDAAAPAHRKKLKTVDTRVYLSADGKTKYYDPRTEFQRNIQESRQKFANHAKKDNLLFLHDDYFLEITDDAMHRRNGKLYHQEWRKTASHKPYFDWIDSEDAKHVDFAEMPRAKMDAHSIKYYGPEELKSFVVAVDDAGRLCYKNRDMMPVDTSKNAGLITGTKFIYVIDHNDVMYVGEKLRNVLQHSSFIGSYEPVLAAGRIAAHEGHVYSISVLSGHYRGTNETHGEYAKQWLNDRGVNTDVVWLNRIGPMEMMAMEIIEDKLEKQLKEANAGVQHAALEKRSIRDEDEGFVDDDAMPAGCRPEKDGFLKCDDPLVEYEQNIQQSKRIHAGKPDADILIYQDKGYAFEIPDPHHRREGLMSHYKQWKHQGQPGNFYDWLDETINEAEKAKLSKKAVEYLSKSEREQYRVVVNDAGALVYAATNAPVDTTSLDDGYSPFTGSKYIFVIDVNNEMYVIEKIRGLYQHSSLIGNYDPVYAAGRITVVNGVVFGFGVYSGHYKPSPKQPGVQGKYVMKWLKERGVNTSVVTEDPTPVPIMAKMELFEERYFGIKVKTQDDIRQQ